MPKRVPKHSVITTREGKITHVHAGNVFEFTDEEVKHLEEVHGKEFLKKHMVEAEDEPEAKTDKPAATGARGRGAGKGGSSGL